MEHLSQPETTHSFGRYRVCRLLGEGAMGRVFLAEDPVLERRVAIKVIAIDKHTEQRTREEYLGRFTTEARACARLNHPSIVTIFDAGEQLGVPWIAFEFVDGDPLEKMLHGDQFLPIERVVAIMIDMASALHHAHECGIIHRDIKPANILVDRRTQIAKLADFGVVKAPWIALTQDGSAVGSPGYMSPEQLEGSGTDARSDLFSLGIVLYQMLTGKHPFLRATIPQTIFATLHGNNAPIIECRPDTPPYLAAIVETLLKSDRTERFQTAAMLLHELRIGSRPHHTAPQFDKNALTGNVTRLHRVGAMLQKIRPPKKLSGKILFYLKKGVTGVLKAAKTAATTLLPITAKVTRILKSHWKETPFLLVPLAGVILAFMYLGTGSHDRAILKELKKEGYTGGFGPLIDTCNYLLEKGDYHKARYPAAMLARTKKHGADGYILLCKASLGEGDDTRFLSACSSGILTDHWQKRPKQVAFSLIDFGKKRLSEKKADSAMITVLTSNVYKYKKRTVAEWQYDDNYHLRWNSSRMAGLLNMKVDSIRLYLLDLEYAGSINTRTHAATRLGELGDKRAIDPLKKAANLGFKDPLLSFTADLVLRNYFKIDIDKK